MSTIRNSVFVLGLIVMLSCHVQKGTKTNTSENWNSPPEECNIVDSTNYQDISLFLMEEKQHPKWLKLQGEDIFDLDESITTIKDIPEDIIIAMKIRVAKAGGCILFVDLHDFYGSEMFPMRKENEVYFYWGVAK